jgi:hypothetical protein
MGGITNPVSGGGGNTNPINFTVGDHTGFFDERTAQFSNSSTGEVAFMSEASYSLDNGSGTLITLDGTSLRWEAAGITQASYGGSLLNLASDTDQYSEIDNQGSAVFRFGSDTLAIASGEMTLSDGIYNNVLSAESVVFEGASQTFEWDSAFDGLQIIGAGGNIGYDGYLTAYSLTFDDGNGIKQIGYGGLDVRFTSGDIAITVNDSGIRIYDDTLTTLRLGINGQTNAAASAGAGGALPATVEGYLIVTVNGTNRRVPYYPA